MAKATEPPSTPARATDPESRRAPNAHLACAYSPRWLSGPTPGFEGLVATGSPSDGDDPSAHPSPS
jgi:hypothetical protein